MSAGEQAALRQDMAAVAFGHRCATARPVGKSSYDDPGPDVATLSNQPCFYTQRTTEEELEVGLRRVIVTELLLLPLTADVADDDLVTAITDQSGTALIARPRGISELTRFASHIRLTLGSVR